VEMTQGRKAYLRVAYPALQGRSVHLGASGALEDPAWLRVAKRPVSANVSQMISAEFMVDCDVENQVAVATEVDVLEHQCYNQVAPPHVSILAWCLLFVLIRQGLRGGSGPQRLIRALGERLGTR